MNHKKILVVEEDLSLRELISQCVSNDFQVSTFCDISKVFTFLDEKVFDLVILNTHNRLGNSIELCRRLKMETTTKVIFLSKSQDYSIKEACFESGADDYITTPFFPKELTLRIKKVLDEYNIQNDLLNFKQGVSLNIKERCIYLNKCTVFLSPTEFIIFEYMFKHHGYHKPEYLLNYVSNRKNKDITLSSLIVLIKRLRDKLEKGTGIELIKTRYGMGYYLSI